MLRKALKNFKLWKQLANFWTFAYFGAILYDFFSNNGLNEYLEIIAFIYVGILAVYVGNKEFERWYEKHQQKHPGEMFVIIWTALIFLLILFDFIFQKSYRLPSAVISSYVAVLTILAITEKSKSLHRRRR